MAFSNIFRLRQSNVREHKKKKLILDKVSVERFEFTFAYIPTWQSQMMNSPERNGGVSPSPYFVNVAKSVAINASPSTKPIFEKGSYLIKAIYSSFGRYIGRRTFRFLLLVFPLLSARLSKGNPQYPTACWRPANFRDKLLIIISKLGKLVH